MPARALRRAHRHAVPAILAGLLVAASLAACGATPEVPGDEGLIQGTGDVVTDIRSLPPFTRVSIAGDFKVIIAEAAQQEVSVAAQQNLLDAIRTEVVDGQLIVLIPSPGVNATQPMSLTLRMTAVDSVALSNGAVGYLEHTGGDLSLDVSGGARITAIGSTPDLTLTASSGSHAMLGELEAQEAQVNINDGSAAELTVADSLTGVADGGSTIQLTTKPATISVETKSGATVQGG
jgi:hypothetical protein